MSTPVALQEEENELGVESVMTGEVELVVKPTGIVIVIELPDPRAPDEDEVKPTVHVELALATSEVGAVLVNVTVEGEEAPAMTMMTLESAVTNADTYTNFLRRCCRGFKMCEPFSSWSTNQLPVTSSPLRHRPSRRRRSAKASRSTRLHRRPVRQLPSMRRWSL